MGIRGKEVLEDAGPELIVNSPEEIMNMIED